MNDRVPSLDGLRAFSVTAVILGHMGLVGCLPLWLDPYARTGVDIFFVISGFLITRLLLREHDQVGNISLTDFYKRRFFRIVPAAYLSVAAGLVFFFKEFRPIDVLSALTFTANYDLTRPRILGGLWSLGVEEQFYILWPLALVAFMKHRTRVLVVALLVYPFFQLLFRLARWNGFIVTSFPTNYDVIALGCLGAVLYEKLTWLRSRWFLLSLPVAMIAYWPSWLQVAYLPSWRMPFGGHTLWPVTHLSLAALVIHCTHHKYLALNAAPIRWIGAISYGLYLWHGFFLLSTWPAITPLGSLAAASISWYCLERPIIQWQRTRVLAVAAAN